MFVSFRSRLVALYTVLTSLALISFSVIIFVAVRYQSYNELELNLAKRSSHVIEQIDFVNGKMILPPSLTRSSTLELRYEALLDEKGKAFFRNPIMGDRDVITKSIDLNSVKAEPQLFDSQLNDNTPVKLAIIGLKNMPGNTYFITASPVAEVEQNLRNLALTMIAGNILFVLLVFGIGNYFVLRALRPVRNITNLAKEISRGDLSKRVDLQGSNDELKELADTFDEMISRLERLIEGQKLFFQDISHELRTPLTIIRGKVDVALRSKKLSVENYAEVLNEVRNETEIAAGLINDLLAAARGEKIADDLKKTEFPIDRMLIEVGARISAIGKQKNIEVVTDMPENIPFILGDELRLGEAFLAICDNAIKYCTSGDYVRIGLSVDAEFAVVSIKDSGPGIGEEDQPFIFERFYRAGTLGKVSRGSGLGLAIAKRVVDSHGGSLELKSSNESGTEFEIKLPLAN